MQRVLRMEVRCSPDVRDHAHGRESHAPNDAIYVAVSADALSPLVLNATAAGGPIPMTPRP